MGEVISAANPEEAFSLKDTDLRDVKGFTKEQKAACKAKGAIVDEDDPDNTSQATTPPPPPLQQPS